MNDTEYPSFQERVISDPQECDLSLKIPLSKYNSSTDLCEVFLLHTPKFMKEETIFSEVHVYTLCFSLSVSALHIGWEVNVTALGYVYEAALRKLRTNQNPWDQV